MQSIHSQKEDLGIFEIHTDVGKVKIAGNVNYNSENQEYLIEGSGTNMWFDQDEFHFLWKRIKGDFILRTRAAFIGEGVDAHRKLGWMVRNSLETNAAHVNASVHGDGLTSLQFRRKKGGDTEEEKSKALAPDIIQLERSGNTFTMSVAKFGEAFVTTTISDLELNEEVYVGLYVCSHNPDVSEKTIFENVRIVIPPGEGFQQYRDYLGSHLEVMDIEKGHRKILYSAPNSLQAPNWTTDGKYLIYNSEGLLYRFDLEKNTPEVINTGFANRNNNDHVLSFDGKMLGISHHDPGDNGNSTIYTMPVEGSASPKKITKAGQSYLHGWSPNKKYLIFTGRRNDKFDIYKVKIKNSKEKQLTDTDGLDDGSEYSPDGKYIYYNSNRTGTMQLWRMKPNGKKKEQLTFDELNDWFPHISPDGKWIAFLSFGTDVDSGDHPFYKRVYLRLMPAEGGTPRIIAYVYGGQGTINVPSWSPDSKKIAFVSNTGVK